MIKLVKTDSENEDFKLLVRLLDEDLAKRDGEEHGFYAQFNKIDSLKNVIVAYKLNQPVGCGAFKPFEPGTVEIKRMYVLPAQRGQGIAIQVLSGLENWAAEQGYKSCVLETGKKQPEAISLYQKAGYGVIPNYGQYAGVENSVCMQKTIECL